MWGASRSGAGEGALCWYGASLAGSTDPALRQLVFTVLADGLRPPR